MFFLSTVYLSQSGVDCVHCFFLLRVVNCYKFEMTFGGE